MTSLMGTSTDKTVLAVDGNALLTFRGPCDVILELKDTVITDSEGKVIFSRKYFNFVKP